MRLGGVPDWFAPALLGLVSLFVLIGAALFFINPVHTSYNVTAQTERISTTIDAEPDWYWVLEDVELAGPGVSVQNWSGDVQLGAPVEVWIERRGFGDLWIFVRCVSTLCESAGGAVEGGGLDRRELPARFEIFIRNTPERARAGERVLLEITGDVTLGRSVGRETVTNVGILRSGEVTMLGRNVFGGGVFNSGSVALAAGDRLEMTEIDEGSSTRGFVTIDERPAMTAAYRVVGSEARVYRPGGGDYSISSSILARFSGDPIFRLLAGILVIASAGAQLLMSAIELRKRFGRQA